MTKLGGVKPKPVQVSAQQEVETTRLADCGDLPVVVHAHAPTGLKSWISENRGLVEASLTSTGGVLFRGFGVATPEEFREVIATLAPELLEYKERSTPRTEVGDRVYTSTEYPAHQHIALHNEFSYSYTWPTRIGFFAALPAEEGGETPIADSRKIYANISEDIRDRFAKLGVMYVRNYGTGVDLSWQDAFQTTEKAAIDEYCEHASLEWEWLPNDRLRTRQRRPAVAKHPVTGEMVWFNQAHLFHVSNLGSDGEAAMRQVFPEEDLPRNAYYGDGSTIPAEVLEQVRQAMEAATVAFRWQLGDVLILDNTLIAHGRWPYKGARKILAALAQPYTLPEEQR